MYNMAIAAFIAPVVVVDVFDETSRQNLVMQLQRMPTYSFLLAESSSL